LLTPQSFVIDAISNLDGSTHEREEAEKGQRIEILRCDNGAPMLVCYRDNGNKIMRTSTVQRIIYTDFYEVIKVYTRNTAYTFVKEAI